MKKVCLFSIAIVLGLVSLAHAGQGITVVLSSRLALFQQARDGFKQAWDKAASMTGPKSILGPEETDFILSDSPDVGLLAKDIKAQDPTLFLAIGPQAFSFVIQQFPLVPTIFLLVPEALVAAHKGASVTGVYLEIGPEDQLSALVGVLPGAKRIGVVFDPRQVGTLVERAKRWAKTRGVTLVTKETQDTRQVGALLAELAGQVDVLWMVPDVTVVTPITLEQIMLFSLENRAPVLTFAEKHLGQGATIAITYDIPAMGADAAGLAAKILKNTARRDLPPPISPTQVTVSINRKVAEKIGIKDWGGRLKAED